VHFYSSSGGNAGLACATAAKDLGRPATVVVPLTTPPHMVDKLRGLGADVVQTGENWAAADAHLRGAVMPAFERGHAGPARAVYVPPFDHSDIWDGVETLVGELETQVPGPGPSRGGEIDAIVCNVGGGGLMCGIMQGVERIWGSARGRPRVLAVETEGAASLHASVAAGALVTLPAIRTIATSLGATRVAEEAFAWAARRAGAGLTSAVVSDREAVVAMARFLDDARMLVESACGATVATVYNGDLRRHLGLGLTDAEWAGKNVVVVVCGGSNINLDMLGNYRKEFGV
jgi:L-serine/L-threonine ammonia-lyase